MQRQTRVPASRVPGRVRAVVLLLVLAGLVAACSGEDSEPSPSPVTGPLSILLVNDDGWDAEGITAVYDALTAAGDRVTLVGPLENQSGRSMSTSITPLTVTRPRGDAPVYAVDGTPVDAVGVGLFGVLADDPPDLVVSGVNKGANVAGNTSYSGTVGAAAAAAEAGVPALAVSADTGAAEEADFADAARLTVRLVDALAADGFAGLGSGGFLNVNVPAETADRDEPRGLRSVSLATGGPRTVTYAQTAPTTWTPAFTYDPRVGRAADDAEQLADGWSTITWMTTARTFPVSRRPTVERLVESVTE